MTRHPASSRSAERHLEPERCVWVTDVGRNNVTRIDAESREVVGAIAVPVRPTDVAVAEGAVWVTSELDGVVTRIDPSP